MNIQQPTFSSLDNKLSNGMYSVSVLCVSAKINILNKMHSAARSKLIVFATST